MASLAASARALLLAGLLRFGAGEKELSDEDWEKINEEENEERVLKLNIIVLTVTILVVRRPRVPPGTSHGPENSPCYRPSRSRSSSATSTSSSTRRRRCGPSSSRSSAS